jgi:acyl dehydratase
MPEVREMYFEDYLLGTIRRSTGRTVTEADLVIHAGQSGDFYPHHMDADWCATQAFGRRFAHGTLLITMAVGMTAGEINPRAMSYGYDRVRFIRPVYVGDTITVEAEMISMEDHHKQPDLFGRVAEQVTATNQDGTVVLSLVHLYIVEKRPASEVKGLRNP